MVTEWMHVEEKQKQKGRGWSSSARHKALLLLMGAREEIGTSWGIPYKSAV